MNAKRFLLILALLPACQDDKPPQIGVAALLPSTPDASSQPPTPSGSQSSSGWQTLYLQGSPNSLCELDPDGSSASPPILLNSDSRGVVRFDISQPTATTKLPTFTLKCTTASGVLSTKTIAPDALGSSQPTLQALAAILPVDAYARPALVGDPMTFSQAELISNGYPPRPDPVASPDAYKTWSEAASRPLTIVPAHIINRPDRRSASQIRIQSDHWSGELLHGAALPYMESEGEWNVPRVIPGQVFTETNDGVSCEWVGLGGFGTQSLVQGGTESDQSYSFGVGGVYTYYASYYPWVEWWPSNQVSFSFGISPGDLIFALSWVGDQNARQNINGTYSWLQMSNYTRGTVTMVSTPAPAGTVFDGSTAEFILEDTGECTWFFGWTCTTTGTLVNFGSATMINRYAFGSDYSVHTDLTDDSYLIRMLSDSGNLMANTTLNLPGHPNNILNFQWYSK